MSRKPAFLRSKAVLNLQSIKSFVSLDLKQVKRYKSFNDLRIGFLFDDYRSKLVKR